MVPDHDVVPVVGVHVALSVLNSTIATLSEAVPATVRSSDPTIAPFDGERIVTCGAILSALRTVTERPVVSASPCESRISNVTVYVPGAAAFSKHVDACVPLMLDGTHEAVTPAGEEAAVSETVPVNPPEG